MIGIISFTVMDWESSTVLSLHGSWSQWLSQKAPQPHDPEASEVTMYSVFLLMRVGIIATGRERGAIMLGLSGMTSLVGLSHQ